MPKLSCLYLQGNPVVNKIRNYRKKLIAMIPNLKYLDDRPVFENDRRCAEAFVSGGVEAERAERMKIREEEEARQRRNFEYIKKVREEGWRKRRIAMGLDPNKKGDPAFDEMSTDSGEIPLPTPSPHRHHCHHCPCGSLTPIAPSALLVTEFQIWTPRMSRFPRNQRSWWPRGRSSPHIRPGRTRRSHQS